MKKTVALVGVLGDLVKMHYLASIVRYGKMRTQSFWAGIDFVRWALCVCEWLSLLIHCERVPLLH